MSIMSNLTDRHLAISQTLYPLHILDTDRTAVPRHMQVIAQADAVDLTVPRDLPAWRS